MKAFSFASVVVLLAACATVPADAPRYTRLASTSPGMTNVYIYRIGAYPTKRRPAVSIDGKTIFAPPEGSYTVVALPHGPHELKVNWSWDAGWPDVTLPFELASDDLYVKITGSFERDEDRIGVYEAGSYARKMDRAAAETEMTKCCRYVAPRP